MRVASPPENSEVTEGERVDADTSRLTGFSIDLASPWHPYETDLVARHLHTRFKRTKRHHQWLEQVAPIKQGAILHADQTLKAREQASSFHKPMAMGEN